MRKAKIICDDCDKTYDIDYEQPSDLFNIKCPDCNGDNTWILNVIDDENNDKVITIGRGGRSQK